MLSFYTVCLVLILPLFPTPLRRRASCQCTCSWSATQQRKCTDPIRASTGLASATAQITPASSSIQTPGPDVVAVPPPSPQRRPCRWTPPTTLPFSSVQSMNKCPPRPAEAEDEGWCWYCWGHFDLTWNCHIIWYNPACSLHLKCSDYDLTLLTLSTASFYLHLLV